jgi:hypothetical protein
MDIKVITLNGEFVDVLGHEVDLALWAEDWIKERDEYWDIEMYNGGKIYVNDDSICFSGDNGRLELTVINKSL